MSRDTPAKRARARRDAALMAPPKRVKPRTDISALKLEAAGRTYPIGENIDGDHPWELTLEGAATVAIPIRSPDASLLDVLADEALIQEQGVRVVIDGVVYAVASVNSDGTGLYTLTLEDEVAWRLRQFSRFMSADRRSINRAGFIYRMVQEASRPPLAPMPAFIPEINDKQPVARTSS